MKAGDVQPKSRKRVDILLVERGLVSSRERAQALILGRGVRVNGRVVDRPGTFAPVGAEIDIIRAHADYVSRGAHKLAAALDGFQVSVEDVVALDVGASTGGFTDVLLRRGARRVYAVDVGYGQFDWRLRNDERVVLMERTNFRHLTELPELIDVGTIDVSFISLRHILPVMRKFLKTTGSAVALVKPQFEAGPGSVPRGGVVRHVATHKEVLRSVAEIARTVGFAVQNLMRSPIHGADGNAEFLLHLTLGVDQGLGDDIVRRIDALMETP
jgi:23S rRNA (cytidine1920-2'-O)/16S rRNA (cytidine1409-2'-O)-methyltransferase